MLKVLEQQTRQFRQDPVFRRWADGVGVTRHGEFIQLQMHELAETLVRRGAVSRLEDVFAILAAADRLATAAQWLVAHMTYARNVYTDGRDLSADDFKPIPEGHTGGALNMVTAYVGYLAANSLTGVTRSWLMGQGHCVAAIDAVNLLVGNTSPAHAARYARSEAGYTRFARDFYSYRLNPDGTPESPVGSHVNAHTAGGFMEGGYLGFAELYYPHVPLPGESLVAFLSDGAFEEQRGGDWAPRWWRAEDSGLIVPIMIANGRRIDQRTTVAQQGGVDWLKEHLRLNSFDPYDIDGEDPAAYVWAILKSEERLRARVEELSSGRIRYPVPVPYAIAEARKGFGLPNAGTNLAHNLPLGNDLAGNAEARRLFNDAVRRLRVPPEELEEAVRVLNNHERCGRPREKDHPAVRRSVATRLPEPEWKAPGGEKVSPMTALDGYFCRVVRANPALRARIGNPDEMSSNKLTGALELLKHRVTAPEPGVPEDVLGGVITALNEESVVCAALANKGGINLVATYEAFGVKMLGALRQELIFTRHRKEAGTPAEWAGIPVVLTSHTWENGKNEQSHQDPAMCESLMQEMADVSRVVFPADWNSAIAAMREVYRSRGQIWTLVTPKKGFPVYFDGAQARALVERGGLCLREEAETEMVLAAIGAYQLEQALKASGRLADRGVRHRLVYLFEPARFRAARDENETPALASADVRRELFGGTGVRLLMTHTRPEPAAGLFTGLREEGVRVRALGFLNRGGTLNDAGMLFTNRCTWAHAAQAAEEMLGRNDLLEPAEREAVEGRSEHPLEALGLKERDVSPAGVF